MSRPGLEEKFGRFRVEYLFLRDERLWIHRKRSLFGKEASMEGVLRQERLAEFRIAQSTIVVLIKASHEQSDLVILYCQSKVLKSMNQVLDAC